MRKLEQGRTTVYLAESPDALPWETQCKNARVLIGIELSRFRAGEGVEGDGPHEATRTLFPGTPQARVVTVRSNSADQATIQVPSSRPGRHVCYDFSTDSPLTAQEFSPQTNDEGEAVDAAVGEQTIFRHDPRGWQILSALHKLLYEFNAAGTPEAGAPGV